MRFFHLSVLFLNVVAHAVMEWQPRTGYPGRGRHHPITFANETHAFLLTGSTSSSTTTSDFYMYTEADDSWKQMPDFPGPPRSFGYGVVLNGDRANEAYVGFGLNDERQLLSDLWRFDMTTLEWKKLANLPSYGRRHPAMVPVRIASSGKWRIHVGLGDGAPGKLNDWWIYDVETDSWTEAPDFPSTARHHPFYFGLESTVSQDWDTVMPKICLPVSWEDHKLNAIFIALMTAHENGNNKQISQAFLLHPLSSRKEVSTSEARVAGTQFSIEGPLLTDAPTSDVSLGFVLSGDGDDHSFMQLGEFHAFHPASSLEASFWEELPPHPGMSRWAPGSFVMRGTTRAYFTSGLERPTSKYYADLWMIDVGDLFIPSDEGEASGTTAPATPSNPVVDPTTTDLDSPTDDGNDSDDLFGGLFSSAVSAKSYNVLLLCSSVLGIFYLR